MADEAPNDKTPSRRGEYARIVPLSAVAIEKLKMLLESRNETVVLGACNTILNKVIPNLKAVEVTGQDGEPIKLYINAGNGFFPGNLSFATTSAASDPSGSTQVQSISVAPASTQDDNSDNGNSETSPS